MRETRFYPCSGQNRTPGGKAWGIHWPELNTYWRLRGKSGRQRLFATYQAAERMAHKLEREYLASPDDPRWTGGGYLKPA